MKNVTGKKYVGLHPKSSATKDRQLDFQAPYQGKMVEYYHCWIPDPEHGHVSGPFRPDETPVKSKIRAVDFIVRFMWMIVIAIGLFYFFTPDHSEPEEIVIHE